MDYQQLFSIVPKPPQKWSRADVSEWLRFIGLESLIDSFETHSIDGSCIFCLDEEDLRTELEIKSGIIIKKLQTWIKCGLTEYQQYIDSKQGDNESLKLIAQSEFGSGYSALQQCKNQTIERNQSSEIQKLNSNFQLFLEQVGSLNANHIYVPRDGAKIGRNNQNDIVISEVEVSRFHAQITSDNNNFYIKDLGTVSGTFFKITGSLEIKKGSLIEVGSHLLEIKQITPNRAIIVIETPDGSSLQVQKKFNDHGSISIGRKNTNDVIIQDDSHLSSNHATIYQVENKFFFKNLNSVNGSWLRLSSQSMMSDPFVIKENSVIRIGSCVTYNCKTSFKEDEQRPAESCCAVCYTNPKDCVTLPCHHNSMCVKCCKTLKECPICRMKIQSFLRIYHN